MKTLTPQVIVLLSGGIDSAAVLASYRGSRRGQRPHVKALFFDYGQAALRSEWHAARAIALHYGVPLHKERLAVRMTKRRGEFFGRNALFVLAAAARMGWRPGLIALGIYADTYYDTTPTFVADLQRVLDGYTAGTTMLVAPFVTLEKAAIVKWARRRRVPLHLTYSCETRDQRPCDLCRSCIVRRSLRVA